MLRLELVTAVVCLTACTPAGPALAVPTAAPSLPPATPTAFLPRGFVGLPGTPASTDGAAPELPTLMPPSVAGQLDLSAADGRLNLLRAADGLSPVLRVGGLDRIAQERAQSLAASGSLWHDPNGGQEAEVEAELAAAGFGGQVAEVVLSVGIAEKDPLGLVLQALLTDPANRGLVLASQFRLLGLGAAPSADSWYVVGLLAEEGPIE